MTLPILARDLRAVDHRIVWWLLANQVRESRDVPTGTVPPGWRRRAMSELGITKGVLYKAEQRLKKAKIIEAAKYRRNTRVRGEAFQKGSM